MGQRQLKLNGATLYVVDWFGTLSSVISKKTRITLNRSVSACVLNAFWDPYSKQARGACTKDVHSQGGGGVSRLWMKTDKGGGGVWVKWMSTFEQLLSWRYPAKFLKHDCLLAISRLYLATNPARQSHKMLVVDKKSLRKKRKKTLNCLAK